MLRIALKSFLLTDLGLYLISHISSNIHNNVEPFSTFISFSQRVHDVLTEYT